VVISDQVNIHRQISTNRLGGVVKTDASAVAAELTRWLNDTALRQDASRRAPEFVRTEYDRELIARRWAAHYAKLATR
jgi:glycosyltransferase involved in cell wall biosynthesis